MLRLTNLLMECFNQNNMKLQAIFDRLWNDYTTLNPSAKQVYDLLINEGESIENDHIAFRTFDDSRINIEVLSQVFLGLGFQEKGEYHFKEKKLYAKHFEHPDLKNAPRVFISQLLLKEFSPELQSTVKKSIDQISESFLKSDDLIFSGRLWDKPSYKTYEKLREESEYAAWLYVYGFMANHFTVNVNLLKKYNSLENLNSFLIERGFLLNKAGGEIKGDPSQLLEQSSIKSGIIKMDFAEGLYNIPGCYYEFAKRYPDKNGDLYSGFIAKSADKIFESTNFYKLDDSK